MSSFIMAISGGSGSGKSKFVQVLEEHLDRTVLALQLDHYYYDLSHLDQEKRSLVNFDDPNSLDWDLLYHHINQLIKGHPIDRPNYDFASHTRQGTTRLRPKEVIILDGIFSLYNDHIYDHLNLSVFIDCDSDIRLARRLLRDTADRGRSIAQIIEQYTLSVRPMHAKFVEPTKFKADFVVPWHRFNDHAVYMMAKMIETLTTRGKVT